MNLIIYLFAIFICLFILFAISRHDFVLIRQNITLRHIFDNSFLIIAVSSIAARLGYIAYTQTFELLSPMKFLYVTKHWGVISFFGFISMAVMIYLLFRKRKNILRIYDIYFVSFSPLVLLDILMQNNSGINIILKVAAVVVLSLFYMWFLKINSNFSLKDGFITSIIIITYSLVSLAFIFSNVGFLNIKYVWFQMIILISLISSTTLLVFIQRNYFNK